MNNRRLEEEVGPERLLSHRLRGFDRHESTVAGLKAALAREVRHVEFDVRLTKDGRFLTFHDPFVLDDHGGYHNIGELTIEEIRTRCHIDHAPFLDEMLECFRKNAKDTATIHVDIKAGGVERCLVDLIRRYDLVDRAVIVSWIPSVLEKVAAIEPGFRLCYSHITFARFTPLYSIAAWVLSQKTVNAAGRFTRSFAPYTGRLIESLRIYWDSDGIPWDAHENDLTGFNHGHLVPYLVGGKMLQLLERTRGMVCIPTVCATKGLVEDYHRRGISVAVFPVRTREELRVAVGRVHPDVLYVDNADLLPGA